MQSDIVKYQDDPLLNFLAEELFAQITKDIKDEKCTGDTNDQDPQKLLQVEKSAIQVE